MRVIATNNYIIPSTSYQEKQAKKITNPGFTGIFSNKPNAFECVKYGIEALDESSLFIATTNRENSNFNLNQYKDKIDIPVIKTYTLDVTKENNPDWAYKGTNNFAIFKKKDDYYILNLNSLWDINIYKGEYDRETSPLKPGEIRKLESGMKIDVLSTFSDKNQLFFERPKKYNTTNAEKYLDVKTTDAKRINNGTIKNLTSETKTNKNSRVFTFADVGGLDNVLDELKKYVIRPINYPEVFKDIRLNKGILLYGPPRCGKTLIGKALAEEAKVPYKYMNANEFKHAHVGESEAIVRRTFDSLISEPTILFIDEFDAIGKARDGSSNARYDDSLVNQILGSMSDLEKSNMNSFVIAATNRRDLLDKALTATGRFGLHLEVPLPNAEGLEQIYKIHAKNKSFGDDVSLKELIPLMLENSFNGSDIAEMITNGYFNALERLGLNKKMDARTFSYEDLKSIKIVKRDLTSAITKIAKQKL